MLRNYKIKFYHIFLGISIYLLLYDNLTCINLIKLIKFLKKEVICILKMINLKEEICNILSYFSEEMKLIKRSQRPKKG
jgi:hypothetical protein